MNEANALQTDNTVYLITESCRPLRVYLSDVQLAGTQKECLVSWGLYQVLVR